MKALRVALLLVPAATFAGSSLFDGTWKTRLDSVKVAGKPDSYLLANGTYTCLSCNPELKVMSDGVDHAVTGHAYYDSVTVKVVNTSTIEITYHRAGNVVTHVTDTLSADGNTYTARFVNYDGTKEISGTLTQRRVSAAPAGAHRISGEWLQDAVTDGNDALRTVTYEMIDDHFRMSSNGFSYDAKFDGKEYPIVGDPGHTTVILRRVAGNTLEETDHRQGKVTDVIRLTPGGRGKTLQVEDQDAVHGQTYTITLDRQEPAAR